MDATPPGAASADAIDRTLTSSGAAAAGTFDQQTLVPAIPPNTPIRVVGDVHGDINGFSYATATDRFIVQLGDLMDHGRDSAATMRMMFDLVEAGRGLFVLGNHELKLARVLRGQHVRSDAAVQATIGQMDDALKARALRLIARAPAWVRHGNALFVHGGFHTAMLEQPPSPVVGRPQGPMARALYGEPTGRIQTDGYPERSLRWVDRIPAGLTVYCGHDCRSQDGRPYLRHGALGGLAVFLDTGAGKGGHLSWIDLD
ncbi:MAG TPA: metallophosphoesterase [Rhodopila sp.]|uniref:metallophosphoesterase n=1 Tax=Rhodopila sp. TaxID=2480087 RepID=UPI002D0E8D9F|nr:metallophosphoesterase [Rhodopila sp.]HVY16844.1 metallophosphoesterase [Rhodopila sp.]